MRSKICGIPLYLWLELVLAFYMTMTLYLGLCWILFGPGSAILWQTSTERHCPNEYLFLLMEFAPQSSDLIIQFLENAILAVLLFIGVEKVSVGALKFLVSSTVLDVIMKWILNAGSLFIYGSFDNISVFRLVWSALCGAFYLFSAFIVYRYQSLLASYLARKSQQPGNSNNDCVVQLPIKKRKTNRQRQRVCRGLNQVTVA